eukprot:TRINITY_DN5150_c0_g1_i1.p1 TRINITY_DN5150_c0_g1~~TRINITY_DN5150_c0_g1_i1.p1  ORF type:complete len:301 (-),score=37.69 TRINITY_DN5150_c0_g1_i1:672-1574(-)
MDILYETLLVVHRCLERLDFSHAVQALQDALNSDLATSIPFLFAPYLLLTACESSYYSLTFLAEQEQLQSALTDYQRYTAMETRSFDTPKIEDTSQLFHLYGKVLRDMEDVSAVLETVSAYDEDTKEVAQAKFISTLLYQIQHIAVARRKLISILCTICDKSSIPNYQKLADSMVPIQRILEESISSPFLTQLKDNIVTEIETLQLLFTTQHVVSQLEFHKSLFLIHQCNTEVQSWSYKYLHPTCFTPLNTGFTLWVRKFLSSLAGKLCFYYYNSFIADSMEIWENFPLDVDYINSYRFP